MRVERIVPADGDIQDEFIGSLDVLTGYASGALYSIRFELAIFLGLGVLWIVGSLSRIRVGKLSKQGKKDSKAFEASQQLVPVVSPLQSPRIADPPRSPRCGSHCSDDCCGAGNHSCVKAEALMVEDLSNIVARLMQLCTEPDEQARHGVYELRRTLTAAGMDFAQMLVSVVKICTAKRNFHECLTIYDMIADELASFTVDRSFWSCLLFCAMESRCYHRCSGFFQRLRATGEASAKDYWNMIRLGSVQGNSQMMLQLIEEMRTRELEVDNVVYNSVMATCVASDQIQIARKLLDDMHRDGFATDVITYNTLMKGYARGGNMDECFSLYDLMRARSIEPSQVTYGILLDGCISNSRADRASEIFDIMTSEGYPLNTVLYTTLIKGFAREGNVDEAMRVFEKMQADSNVSPDLITFSVILKANCDAGRLEVAMQLLGVILRSGLSPDEVIFNNLLAGCAKQGNATLAKRIYTNMLSSRIKPSNATFSILIRLFAQCNLLDEATEMLRLDPARYHVVLEARLFSQLIHSCVRARQGRKALEVYEMMCGQIKPTPAMHSSILSMCVKLNMFETINELLEAIAQNGGAISQRDARQVVESVRRKKKGAIVDACVAAINSVSVSEERHLHRHVTPEAGV
eukprot:TRINITY_DN22326_c0_g1_i1.p1 TRINITY_DN22326_c0_g1~~TRINITY_DN22326_c0_g1_i1.p1  ORF type:complete len:634 (+),score=106.76 TRINITY_DN22326_c0_g1_i1:175-2076(+)